MIRDNVPLQISRGIFIYGEIIKMHTIYEGNYTVIKLLPIGKCKWKKRINKHQAPLMRLRHLAMFTQIIHSWIDTRQRRTADLQHFSKEIYLMIINFENAASHKYVVQKAEVYEWLGQKWLDFHFLFLSKNDTVLKIPFANFGIS